MRLLSLLRDKFRGIEGSRSSQWRKTEKAFLKEHPICSGCNTTKRLEVHHIKPFYLNPELELELINLMTLCRQCHHFIGHLNDWKSYNADASRDATAWFQKITHRP